MKERFAELYELFKLDRKRSPWSRANTWTQRWGELADEVEEIRQAIDSGDMDNLQEELGDALGDLLFLMVMAEEQGLFSAKDVIESKIVKQRRRKPWIFSDEKLSAEEEHRRWMQVKDEEKRGLHEK